MNITGDRNEYFEGHFRSESRILSSQITDQFYEGGGEGKRPSERPKCRWKQVTRSSYEYKVKCNSFTFLKGG